jgi:WD40 repeat protein
MYDNTALIWDLRKVTSHVDEIDVDFITLKSIHFNHTNDLSVVLCADTHMVTLYDIKTGYTVGHYKAQQDQ